MKTEANYRGLYAIVIMEDGDFETLTAEINRLVSEGYKSFKRITYPVNGGDCEIWVATKKVITQKQAEALYLLEFSEN